MKVFSELTTHLADMMHNKLGNYIVPGLTSVLIGDGDKHGKVRLFMADRETRDTITPHSHRFDFHCVVLRGHVRNALYIQSTEPGDGGMLPREQWCLSTIDQVCGVNGIRSYHHTRDNGPLWYAKHERLYSVGQEYGMKHMEIHSITFSKDAMVLFFEGPPLTSVSKMIEPWVNGRVVPTFETKDWMFEAIP